MGEIIRPRRDEDVPALVEVLAEQRPTSRYPIRWPLPFPVEDFIAREGELLALVAEVDGQLAGHISVLRPVGGPDGPAPLWAAAHGRPAEELAVVTAFFIGTPWQGTGLGGRMLDKAVEWIHANGYAACLDVVQGFSPAADIYRRRGWVAVGEFRPDWLPDEVAPMLAMVLPVQPRQREDDPYQR
ncbi:GNAT family N-acetyltransferase [Actinomycetota bacterium]